MDPETERLINLLRVCLRILGITNRDIARRIGLSPSYVSKLFSGSSEMRLDHVIRICRAADLDPSEFFSLAYPRPTFSGSVAADKLRELLQSVQPPPPPSRKETLSEEEVAEIMKKTLEKLMGRSSGS
ncbi:MAG TPA: helix-turn-helix domain-containing protein [Thermoanaerobaculia bacterium]|jgi:transcriptional regulator with XRE-family HTH domain